MTTPEQRNRARGSARIIGYTGAAIFLLGGKFLYEIKHINFFAAEACGITAGSIVLLVGVALEMRLKSRP